ncbi:MAG TPA: hypothetical protein VJK07_03220 [Candidatus Nanoarchaeia archaeon]|nr:hypothetical protein [Candidatus Nanoarchaeia archaeon]
MKSFIILLKILVLSALLIIGNNNLALHDSAEREQFFDLYLSWLSGFYDKAVYVTGYAVRAEWLPSQDFEINKTS